MISQTAASRIEQWPIDKLVFYARNPRKNDTPECGTLMGENPTYRFRLQLGQPVKFRQVDAEDAGFRIARHPDLAFTAPR